MQILSSPPPRRRHCPRNLWLPHRPRGFTGGCLRPLCDRAQRSHAPRGSGLPSRCGQRCADAGVAGGGTPYGRLKVSLRGACPFGWTARAVLGCPIDRAPAMARGRWRAVGVHMAWLVPGRAPRMGSAGGRGRREGEARATIPCTPRRRRRAGLSQGVRMAWPVPRRAPRMGSAGGRARREGEARATIPCTPRRRRRAGLAQGVRTAWPGRRAGLVQW